MGNQLAVMCFENLSEPADSSRMGEIMSNLLITDLTEARTVQVISSQRLYDVYAEVGPKDIRRLDRTNATKVAQAAGTRWMITGSILQFRPRLIVTSQLVDVATGNSVGSQKISWTASDLFGLVDSLTLLVQNDLLKVGVPKAAGEKSVADLTTHSAEAYQAYIEGLDNLSKLYNAEASRCFRQAIGYDTTFAQAYYYLAGLTARNERVQLIAKAVKFSGKISKREQSYIKARSASYAGDFATAMAILKDLVTEHPGEVDAWFMLGQYEYSLDRYRQAVDYFSTAVAIDPFYKQGFNLLAYTYDRLGEFDKAMQAIDHYIAVAPGEANPYDTKGEICARNGRLDDALTSYQHALSIKANFENAKMSVGIIYAFAGDYATADTFLRAAFPDDAASCRGIIGSYLAAIQLFQGHTRRAFEIIDSGVVADSISGILGEQGVKHFLKAIAFHDDGDLRQALVELRKSIDLYHQSFPGNEQAYRYLEAQFLAEAGDTTGARNVAELIKANAEKDNLPLTQYWYATGGMALANGGYKRAVEELKKAADITDFFYSSFVLGVALLKADMNSEAVNLLQKWNRCYTSEQMVFPIWRTELHYYLGRAYEASREKKKAAEQYRTYLDILKSADKESQMMQDARLRLRALQGQS